MIENYENIQMQVKKVLSYSQAILDPKVEELMRDWATNKEDIYKAFGNRYIYEVGHVEVHLDEETKDERFEDFVEPLEQTWSTYYNEPFVQFLKEQKSGFFENRVVKDFIAPDGVAVRKGTKLLKCFRHYWTDKEDINEWQTRASMLIQDNKLTGTLCLSIHPLDFLSMSENASNWRSCHALDGEYRSGILSYIADSATIITYIKGDGEFKLPNFPNEVKWNNKKWRLLLERSESGNFLAVGRQYPMRVDMSILNKIKETYALLFNKHDWSEWHDDQIEEYQYKNSKDSCELRYKYIPIRRAFYKLNDIVKNCDNPLHYNDLLYSTCSTPMFAWSEQAKTKPQFTIGHAVKCIQCGENNITTAGESHMLCDDCVNESYDICPICEEHHIQDDMIWVDSEQQYVCSGCIDEYYTYCESCGEYYSNDWVYYDEETDQYYCESCYEDLMKQRNPALDEHN